MTKLRFRTVAPFLFGLLLCSVFMESTPLSAQDELLEPKVDFAKTIQPILAERCTTCHNAADEEGGLDLTDADRLQEYIVAGRPLESNLYLSLTGAEGLSVMPPEEDNDGNPLDPVTNAEMTLIYHWIQQGASLAGLEVEEKKEEPKSAAYRIFLFSGYFHPAVVHFPIALITMSAFFIVVFFRIESLSDDAAYYLLFFGTLSAVVASVLGWGFADKNPVSITDMSLGINRHRWFGIGGTALAIVCTVLGWRSRSEVIGQRSGLWKFGVILTAVMMGIVGHQGGEEVYGEGVYERAAEKLIPEYWPFGEKGAEVEGPQPNADNSATDTDDSQSDAADQESGGDDAENQPEPDAPAEADPQAESADDSPAEKNGQANSPPSDPTIRSGTGSGK